MSQREEDRFPEDLLEKPEGGRDGIEFAREEISDQHNGLIRRDGWRYLRPHDCKAL